MKKLLLTLALSLILIGNAEAGRDRVFLERGIIPFAGLDDTTSTPISNDNKASDLQNITLGLSGNIQKRYGYSEVVSLDINDKNATNEPVTGIYELYKTTGLRYRLAVLGYKIFSWELGGTSSDITGSIAITRNQDNLWSWITALDYAIGINGTDPPIQWNGIGNASTLSFTGLSSSITKAKCVTWWKNYLIFGNTVEGGTTYATRIRWSNVGTIGTWSNADYVDIAIQGGQQIEGFGQLYDNLIIFLTDSIYKVSLVGGNELIVVTKVSDKTGCIAKNSIQNISIGGKEGLIFLSKDGSINFLDGVNISEVSLLIHGTLDDLSSSRLQYAVSAVDLFNSHYYLSVTDKTDTISTTTNNLLLDYYFEIGEWFKHIQVDANSMCIANDSNNIPQIYFGNYGAFIYQLNNSSYKSDVAGLNGTVTNGLGNSQIATSIATGLTVLYDTTLSNSTVLLLHGEGVNGANSFVDVAGKTLTPSGNVQTSTANYKFGSSSILFDGTGDYLTVPDSDDWHFGSGEFTVELWVRWNGSVETTMFFSQYDTAQAVDIGWRALYIPNDALYFYYHDGTSEIATFAYINLVIDTWYHIAFVRTSNTLKYFVNGVSQSVTGSNLTGKTFRNSGQSLYIGAMDDSSNCPNAWYDEIRISKGVARWTSNFTPSTSPYTNADIINRFTGATMTITGGTGISEELLIASTTSSGLVVTGTTTATGLSTYSIGAIDSFYVTKWYDTGNAMLRKNFKELNLWNEVQQSETIGVSYATDEDTSITTKSVDLSGGNEFGGTSISTGLNVASASWTGKVTNFSQTPLDVSGRYIKLRFGDYNIDDTMNLWGYSILLEDLDYK